MNWSTAIIVATICIQLLTQETGGEQYCDAEVFSPSCAADEVVVVSEALYGRMRVGKCIEAEYAFSMGCASNVLPYLDLHCSGRRSCSVPVTAWNLLTNSQRNCTSKLQSYLEVHFSCIKVATCQLSNTALSTIDLGSEGYLSSDVTLHGGCGGVKDPWTLTARPGQKITINLIDYAYSIQTPAQATDIDTTCTIYATIKDTGAPVANTVCGVRRQKESSVFTSTSHVIEVGIVPPKDNKHAAGHFLLKYVVEGCADPELPDGAWIMRDAHEAVVGCSNSPNHVTWLLTCTHEGQWVGPYVTCSSSGPVAVSPQQVPVVGVRNTVSTPSLLRPVLQSNHQEESSLSVAKHSKSKEDESFLTSEMLIIVISIAAVCLTVIIFIIGIVYIRRKHPVPGYEGPVHVSHMTYGESLHSMPPPPLSTLPASRPGSGAGPAAGYIDSSTTKRASEFRFVNTAARQADLPQPPTYDNMYPPAVIASVTSGTRRYLPTTTPRPTQSHSAVLPTATVDVYPYTNASTAYNAVNTANDEPRGMSADHIYERTFVTTVPEPCHEDVGGTTTT